MGSGKDLSKYFSKGQELETSLSTSSIFSRDSGLHLMSYKVSVNNKHTVIDNLSVYGSTILVLEAKNFTYLEGTSQENFWKGKGSRGRFTIPSTLRQNQYHVKLLLQYLESKGLNYKDYQIAHYIVVPDYCEVYVDDVVRKHLLFQSELTSLKQALAYYNTELNTRIVEVIKEGLF